MKGFICGVAFAFISSNAYSEWENTSGTVISMNNYASTDTVLVKLSSPGVAVTECSNKDYFAIDGSLPENRRSQMYSALLAAKASGNSVTVAYENTGGCVPYGNNSSAYRGIRRIIH